MSVAFVMKEFLRMANSMAMVIYGCQRDNATLGHFSTVIFMGTKNHDTMPSYLLLFTFINSFIYSSMMQTFEIHCKKITTSSGKPCFYMSNACLYVNRVFVVGSSYPEKVSSLHPTESATWVHLS